MPERPTQPGSIDRRRFLAAGTVSVGLGFIGLERALRAGSRLGRTPRTHYGPLQPDPAGVLDLPRGFSYTSFSIWGQRMDDGYFVPALHDGMACFPHEGSTCILVRNHEVSSAYPPRYGPFGWQNELLESTDKGLVYDPGTEAGVPVLGGTTTVLFDLEQGKPIREWLSLTGTGRNCAGGSTPWGTWLTCEEWTQAADTLHAANHGYVFEVPASTEMALCKPEPIRAMGRFRHEAVAANADGSVIYLTEDRDDCCLYRYLPDVPGKLLEGGRLQALAISERPGFDTRNWTADGTTDILVGQAYQVQWIDVDDVDGPEDDLRYRSYDQGAARFARGEGIWHGEDAVYWACTTGGQARLGQIFKLSGSAEASGGQAMELFLEAEEGGLVENADNLTIAPNGDLFLCEDGPGTDGLTRVTMDGELERFAQNRMNASELCGACFSPDGKTLFVNIQTPGVTLAITGPWLT